MPRSELQDNLRVLVATLQQFISTDETIRIRVASPHKDCPRSASMMPLSHARGTRGFQSAINQGRLLSMTQLRKLGPLERKFGNKLLIEDRLGTADFVFTYCGPCRYLGVCGFLFANTIENERADEAVATPFDTGGLVDHFVIRPDGIRHSDQERLEFLRKTEMPVPQYREYFRLTLEALFESPRHYVDGTGPNKPLPFPPFPLSGGDARRWTFEVRFNKELSLTEHLLAVFIPANVASDHSVLKHTQNWTQQGVFVRPYPRREDASGKELLDETVRFIKNYLRWQD